jgi:hypothetical protein
MRCYCDAYCLLRTADRSAGSADEINIAVAANFLGTLQQLAPAVSSKRRDTSW